MIKLFIKHAISLACVTLVITSCEYNTITPSVVDLPDSISFSKDIQPIFEANCNASGCHNNGGIAPVLTAGNSYTNLFLYEFIDTTIAPEETELMDKLRGSMEKYILPKDYEFLLLWIEQNAPDN